MTRDEWLDSLDWRGGEPPRRPVEREGGGIVAPVAIQYDDGARYVVGDVNAAGGACDCCEPEGEIVRWAPIIPATPPR